MYGVSDTDVELLREGAGILNTLELGLTHRGFAIAAVTCLSKSKPGFDDLWSAAKRMAMVGKGLTPAMIANLSDEDSATLRRAVGLAAELEARLPMPGSETVS